MGFSNSNFRAMFSTHLSWAAMVKMEPNLKIFKFLFELLSTYRGLNFESNFSEFRMEAFSGP
jgi:hypothetical protein